MWSRWPWELDHKNTSKESKNDSEAVNTVGNNAFYRQVEFFQSQSRLGKEAEDPWTNVESSDSPTSYPSQCPESLHSTYLLEPHQPIDRQAIKHQQEIREQQEILHPSSGFGRRDFGLRGHSWPPPGLGEEGFPKLTPNMNYHFGEDDTIEHKTEYQSVNCFDYTIGEQLAPRPLECHGQASGSNSWPQPGLAGMYFGQPERNGASSAPPSRAHHNYRGPLSMPRTDADAWRRLPLRKRPISYLTSSTARNPQPSRLP